MESRRDVFVGRGPELARMHEAWERAVAGRGGGVMLAGEPGIGKTRLADAFSAECRARGALVLLGRCWDAGGAPAWWPWIQVVRGLSRRLDATARAEVDGPAPALGVIAPEPGAPVAADPVQLRFLGCDAITSTLRRCAARQPTLVLLDDLHAADDASLAALRFLLGQIGDERLLVVGTWRSVDARATPAIEAHLAAVSRVAATIHVQGLDVEAVGRFVAESSGAIDRELATALHATTRGNPLFVDGVVRAAAASGGLARGAFRLPDDVQLALADRLRRCGGATTSVLRAAAIVGRPAPLALLQQVAGSSLEDALAALDEAVGERLLAEAEAGRYVLAHPLLRDAVEREIPEASRMRLHLEAGHALEGTHPEDPGDHLAELAVHFALAGPLETTGRAVRYAREAAAHAARVASYEEAIAHLDRAGGALIHAPRHDDRERTRREILLARADAELGAGRSLAARATFVVVADLARAADDVAALAASALGFSRTCEFGVLDPERFARLEEALERVAGSGSPLEARLLARIAMDLWSDPASTDRRDAMSGAALALARTVGDLELLGSVLVARILALWGPEHLGERLERTAELERLAATSGSTEARLEACRMRLNALVEVGDAAGAHVAVRTYRELATALRRPQLAFNATIREGLLPGMEGRYAEAYALAQQLRELGRRAGDPQGELIATARMALFHAERGEHEALRPVLAELRPHAARLPNFPMYRAMLVLGQYELGDVAGARADWARCLARDLADLPRDMTALATLALFARAACVLADPSRADALAARIAPYAGLHASIGASHSFGAAASYLGLLDVLRGRTDDAIDHLEAGLQLNQRMGAAPWEAWTATELAAALLARGRRADRDRAAALAGSARRLSEALGLRPLLRRLRAMEAPPPAIRAPRTGRFARDGAVWCVGLDGREVRVRDSRGLAYLAALLAKPDVEIPAIELASPGRPRAAEAALPGLDAKAKAAYRARLEDLRDTVEEAEDRGDLGRAERARTEMHALASELSRAVGLGGRDRPGASAVERARVAVTKAIGRAIAQIADELPELARHLENNVKTGAFCSYTPEAASRIAWNFSRVTS
jgi:hypothetical protein